MSSLFKACNEIQGTGIFNYTIGNNNISIEAFDSVESFNLIKDLPSQENIVLIKSDNIVINSGQILTPTNPKKSLVLFCDTLTNNGTISMTGKGPNVLPHEYVILKDDSIFSDVIIPAYANNRIKRRVINSMPYIFDGTSGKNGTNRQCGSGGQGVSTASRDADVNKRLGATGSGYAFGGGAGAGGKSGNANTVYESDVDVSTIYPMRGSPGYSYTYFSASGGVGNPSGAYSLEATFTRYSGHNGASQPQNIGVGGRIIIFCNTFINNGNIQANGVAAYSSDMFWSASGGASGGGAIDIFYSDSYQQGTLLVNGGLGGDLAGEVGNVGNGEGISGNGGNGSVTISKLNCKICEEPVIELKEFNYTGETQAVNLTPGIYEFYCRGAQGGGSQGLPGDSAKARIFLDKQTAFYINVGQQALNNLGGWNGGGNGTSFGGGGSTDIAVHGLFKSNNWNTEQHLNSRIITAIGGKGGIDEQVIKTENTSSTYPPGYELTLFTITPNFSGLLIFKCTSWGYYRPIGYIRKNGIQINAGFDTPINVIAGETYVLSIIYSAVSGSSGSTGTGTFQVSYPASPLPVGGAGGGLNYIYTQETKDDYPLSPCNAEDYYMRNPVINIADPESIGDGYVAIKQIAIVTNKPSITNTYSYTGSPQTAVINNFDSNIMSISNNIQTNAGTYDILVTPKEGYYWEDGTNTAILIPWIIQKIDPEVTWPEATPIELSDSINQSNLINGIGAGLFTWTNPLQKTNILLPGYEATFTPTDLTNYNIIQNIISIEIIFPDRLNSNIYR